MGIRTVMEYIAVVMGGAALLTAMVRGLGILPSPGSAGLITSTYAALVTFLLLLQMPGLYLCAWIAAGWLLFRCTRRTAQLPATAERTLLVAASSVISVVVAAIFTPAYVPVLFTPSLGLLVSQAFTALCAGATGAFFGLVLLPRARTLSLTTSPLRRGHWVAIGLWALLLCLGTVRLVSVRVALALVNEPQPRLIFARWEPGDEPLRAETDGPGLELTAQEIQELRDAGLTGVVRSLGGQGGAFPSTRFVVVMSRPVKETVDLPKAKTGDILYIQTQQGWRKFPAAAPTVRRTLRLAYFPPSQGSSLPSMRPHMDIGLGHPSPRFHPEAWAYSFSDWPDSWQVDPPSLTQNSER